MRPTKSSPLTTTWPLLITLASASLGLPALAQPLPPLPPAEHSVEIVSSFSHIVREERAVPLNLAVDWVGQWGDLDYSMQGTAETSGGLRPTAAVQAEVSSGNGAFNFRTDAIIRYYVRIRPRGTPPPGIYSVPALAHALGEASGNALAQVIINNGFPNQAESSGTNDHRSFEALVPVIFYPSDPESNLAYVQVRAFARAYNNHPSYASSSQAYADPFFSFDQAAFDFEQGQNTFPLADYFEFEYSDHILNPPCLADFNGDSAVDFFDYLDFVDAFSAQLPAADFNQDSSIDFFDYLDFVDAFSTGC